MQKPNTANVSTDLVVPYWGLAEGCGGDLS